MSGYREIRVYEPHFNVYNNNNNNNLFNLSSFTVSEANYRLIRGYDGVASFIYNYISYTLLNHLFLINKLKYAFKMLALNKHCVQGDVSFKLFVSQHRMATFSDWNCRG